MTQSLTIQQSFRIAIKVQEIMDTKGFKLTLNSFFVIEFIILLHLRHLKLPEGAGKRLSIFI
jgi:NADPH-dependent 7-cyano-7-deazaguanine reductase QueF-like protein